MKNLLLTGATGFIGKHLLKALSGQYDIYLLVRKTSEYSTLQVKGIFEFDDNIDELHSFLKEKNIEGIVHLATLYINQHRQEDIKQLVLSNIYLGTALLEASSATSVKWFVNTGTYWQHYHSASEEYHPVNLYAATKQAFVDLAQYYTETSSLQFVTLKICDTYGPSDTRRKIFNLFKEIAETGETLDMSAGEQLIETLYIDDVISGFVHLIALLQEKTTIKQEYILSAQQRYSLRKLAEIFEDVSGKPLHINWGMRQYKEREVMIPWEKGTILPGWAPEISIEDGLKKFINSK